MEYYHLDPKNAFLVSQKALIIEADRVLLVKDVARSKWELPGGLLELGENLALGLKREVYEETGLSVEIGAPISVGDTWFSGFVFRDGRSVDAQVIVITYRCTCDAGAIRLSDEHTGFVWAETATVLDLDLAADCAAALQTFLNGA